MEGESEINNFIQVWIMAIACLTYCYYVASRISCGVSRLLSIVPICVLFILLPLKLTTIHLGGFTAVFLVWLTNFKLLLFAFDKGPLFPLPSKLLHFLFIACLPIKFKQQPPSQQKPKSNADLPIPRPILLAVKLVLLALIFHSYTYKHYLHENIVSALYCCHIYLQLEFTLAMCGAPVRAISGFELEPQFHEPYLATSLQDFWSRRWNLMVSGILRPTVYVPTRRILRRIIRPKWAQLSAVFAVFVVSGLMHEVIFYYVTRAPPTWEVTSFFVLHGVCLVVEVAVKPALSDRWRFHPVVSGPLVVAFVGATAVWLFLPPLLRNGLYEKFIAEILAAADLLKKNINS